MRRFLVIFLLCLPPNAWGSFKGYFSAEEKYDPLNAVLQNSLKAKLEKHFAPFFQTYLVAGNEGSSTARNPFVFQLGTYAYAGPGLKFSLEGFTLSGDVRFRRYLLKSDDPFVVQPAFDVQALFTYENYWDRSLYGGRRVNGFIEIYTETLFSTADFGNITHNSLAKAGVEWNAVPNTSLAAYVEPSFLLDTIGHYYNNRAELRFAGRLRFKPRPVELELNVSYLLNQYFDVRLFEENPNPNRNSGIAAKLFLSLRV